MIERRPNKFLKGRPHFCRKKHCMFRDSSSLKVSTILLCSLLLSILFIYDGCICYSPHLCVVFLFLILYPGLLRRLLLQPPPHTHNTHTHLQPPPHTQTTHTSSRLHTHTTHTQTHTHTSSRLHTHTTHTSSRLHTHTTHTHKHTHHTHNHTHTHQHTHTTHTHKHTHKHTYTHNNTHTTHTHHTHTHQHTHTAGVAQTHIYRRFAWQAWHLLRGRRGTYGTGWRPWARFRRA